MGGYNHGFAPGQAVPRGNVAGAPTLLEELLDQARGNAETMGHLGPSPLIVIVGSKNPFPQIE